MREIKFRAWDNSQAIMHKEVEFIRSGTEQNDWIIFKSNINLLENGEVLTNPYCQQQINIMQYTGLKDENGEEIYANSSIVEFNYDEGNGYFNKVIGYFYLNVWQYRLKVIKSENKMGVDNLPMAYQSPKDLRVIGTLQENPELLETK